MSMKVKVDEDLPQAVVELLRRFGYDAAGVYEHGMSGWKDEGLWQAIQAEGRFLVTADKGFGDIRPYPPGTHPGVLVLRPAQQGVRPILDLLHQVLSSYSLESLRGCIVVAGPRGMRIRRR